MTNKTTALFNSRVAFPVKSILLLKINPDGREQSESGNKHAFLRFQRSIMIELITGLCG